jgi:hypothetical protein
MMTSPTALTSTPVSLGGGVELLAVGGDDGADPVVAPDDPSCSLRAAAGPPEEQAAATNVRTRSNSSTMDICSGRVRRSEWRITTIKAPRVLERIRQRHPSRRARQVYRHGDPVAERAPVL